MAVVIRVDLSPRGYRKEDYATLYNSPSYTRAPGGPGNSSRTKEKACDAASPSRTGKANTDTIVISNAKEKKNCSELTKLSASLQGTPVRDGRKNKKDKEEEEEETAWMMK